MSKLPPYDTKPWYQQFWPWFLIGLPGTVVVAALSTVFIAVNNADPIVNDEYYSDGLAIEQVLEYDLRAREYKLTANIVWDDLTGEILLTLQQSNSTMPLSFPQQLRLQLLHPGNEDMDDDIYLSKIVDGHYRADIESLPSTRYYLRLSSVPDEQVNVQWRLQGELNFSVKKQVDLLYH